MYNTCNYRSAAFSRSRGIIHRSSPAPEYHSLALPSYWPAHVTCPESNVGLCGRIASQPHQVDWFDFHIKGVELGPIVSLNVKESKLAKSWQVHGPFISCFCERKLYKAVYAINGGEVKCICIIPFNPCGLNTMYKR